MNYKMISYIVSLMVLITGLAMLSAVLVSMLMGDPAGVAVEMFAASAVSMAAGIGGMIFSRHTLGSVNMTMRDGFASVFFSWVAASAFGSLPFIIAADMYWYDAFFETVSGFTTTGASVIDSQLKLMNGQTFQNGVESMPYGLLFWRSLTHWLGGMGIVVLSIAILPLFGIGGQTLYNAEVPGVKTQSDQFTPRIANTAKILWGVYVALTLIETVLLWFGGMSFFDSLCHSFGTIATGGFSTKQNSIAFYPGAYIQIVIAVFMLLAGCNFILHFRALTGRPFRHFLDEEFRYYFAIVAVSILVIAAYLFMSGVTDPLSGTVFGDSYLKCIRYSAFQVASIISTTGYCTADFNLWPASACMILLALMFIGGCGGSTAGGMKCVRSLLISKFGVSEMRRCIFPRALPDIRLNGKRIETSTMMKTLGFFSLFLTAYFLFSLLLPMVCKMDFVTAMTASIACLSNVGPGLGLVGPSSTYGWMNGAAKMLLSFEMILGRLELYTVMVVLLPSFWKR